MLLLLQAAGGAAAEGEGVPAGPEGHTAAANTWPGAGQSPTQATRYSRHALVYRTMLLLSRPCLAEKLFFLQTVHFPPSSTSRQTTSQTSSLSTGWRSRGQMLTQLTRFSILVHGATWTQSVVLKLFCVCPSLCWRNTHWLTFSAMSPKMTCAAYVYGIYFLTVAYSLNFISLCTYSMCCVLQSAGSRPWWHLFPTVCSCLALWPFTPSEFDQ